MDNNRTILAIALIVLLWSGYSLFFSPQPIPVEAPIAEQQVQQEVPEKKAEVKVTTKAEEVVSGLILDPDYQEKMFSVESDLYSVKLSTTGATIRGMTLKKYRVENDETAPFYELITEVPQRLATFQSSGSEGFSIPADQPFELVGEQASVIKVQQSEKVISFAATTLSGLKIIKNYTFYPDSYQIDLKVDLVNTGDHVNKGIFNLSLVSALNEDGGKGMQDMYTFNGPLSFNGEELLEDDQEDLDKSSKIYGADVIWSGYVSKYFLTILNPQGSAKHIQIEKGDGFVQNKFVSPFVTLEPGQKFSLEYVSFFGPKDYDLMKAAGHQFEQAKDYGFFRVLAQPLMMFLKFIYGFIGNYGLAIILLTVCIKIIFWPLTQKSYKSMKGMQKLQPEMQKMREKYGSDKQRLNQEMMAFYKENKVNPLGGCLPMLIQIPVFFALYQVLLGAIELRHAPFMLWITDLSAADTLFTDLFNLPFTLGPLPLIMGYTMFLQQKMTPTNMDPMQAKIMLMMPVVFTFLFLNFPSGLVLYWMVNNLLTILQQYLIRRQPD